MGYIKGTDRLCKVVELSMQCCGQILKDCCIFTFNHLRAMNQTRLFYR